MERGPDRRLRGRLCADLAPLAVARTGGALIEGRGAVALTLPTDKLGLKRGLLTGHASLRRSSVIDPTLGLPRPISGPHPNDWELHFKQGLPRWKATWGFDIFGQWRETNYRFDEIDTDVRDLRIGRLVYFRVLKTFG